MDLTTDNCQPGSSWELLREPQARRDNRPLITRLQGIVAARAIFPPSLERNIAAAQKTVLHFVLHDLSGMLSCIDTKEETLKG